MPRDMGPPGQDPERLAGLMRALAAQGARGLPGLRGLVARLATVASEGAGASSCALFLLLHLPPPAAGAAAEPRLWALRDDGSDRLVPAAPARSLVGWCARTGLALSLDDARADPRFCAGLDWPPEEGGGESGAGPHAAGGLAMLCVPVFGLEEEEAGSRGAAAAAAADAAGGGGGSKGGRPPPGGVVGVLQLARRSSLQRGGWSAEEQATGRALAAMASVALAAAKSCEEERRCQGRLASLARIAAAAGDLAGLVEAAQEEVAAALQCDTATVRPPICFASSSIFGRERMSPTHHYSLGPLSPPLSGVPGQPRAKRAAGAVGSPSSRPRNYFAAAEVCSSGRGGGS